ncbi:MAG: PAS domain-containing protein [Deltaproteobacteria bacterium]|jgi:hypothetical protein|nr:PAS domain-containing protein [Deltaproteobacteria bacterium]MBT6434812.1 PAS domain-containing protein [Deltaproteobacteria bacterium]MBT6492253.1 PAS domain-containing protein [Deltaproteobacteria bacterium]
MENKEQKRRVSEILGEYWDGLCQGGSIPREGDVDLGCIDEVIDHVFMVEVLENAGNERFKHCFLGPAITLAYGVDETAEEVYDQLVGTYREQLQMKLECVIESSKASDEESEFVNSRGLLIRYRQCLLPLRGNTTDDVEYILGSLTWRSYKVFNRKDNKQFFTGEPIDDRENVFSSPPPPAPVVKKGPPPPAPVKKKV